ncbi:YidH family protein [Xylanimonas cellulosilytica]|nr:DUF202 domain-containing protein [Xylanimonas cellulosilytica]
MSGGTHGTGERHERDRFPASVYGQGSEPDARFSLANERTFLAWIRTSLALMAGGVAALAWRRTGLALTVAMLGALRVLPAYLGASAYVFVALGAGCALTVVVASHRRYRQLCRALTSGDDAADRLPSGRLPTLLAALVAGGGLLAIAVVLGTLR